MNIKYLFAIAMSVTLLFSSCQKDNEEVTPAFGYNTPSTYSFVDGTGKSTVNTKGQYVRLRLIQKLVAEIAKAENETVNEQTLLDLFQKNNEELGFYDDITNGKSLLGKTLVSGKVDNMTQAGIDTLERWLGQVADMSGASGTYIRADGVDLKQAVEKFLMGAVVYDQGVNKYLAITPVSSNTNPTPGKGTSMEHVFDEAFGYFGSSRYFNELTNDEIINNTGIDVDGVSGVDSLTEANFYYATTAAKREKANVVTKEYTDIIFDNFLAGRAAITNVNYIARDAAIAAIEKNWEEIIAATTVHYINDLIGDLDANGDVVLPNADLSKHWTEMYYYFNMLVIDANTKLSSSDKSSIATLMGDNGGYASPVGVTKANLETARDYFSTYFSATELTQW